VHPTTSVIMMRLPGVTPNSRSIRLLLGNVGPTALSCEAPARHCLVSFSALFGCALFNPTPYAPGSTEERPHHGEHAGLGDRRGQHEGGARHRVIGDDGAPRASRPAR
jgi:hypothetical protein